MNSVGVINVLRNVDINVAKTITHHLYLNRNREEMMYSCTFVANILQLISTFNEFIEQAQELCLQYCKQWGPIGCRVSHRLASCTLCIPLNLLRSLLPLFSDARDAVERVKRGIERVALAVPLSSAAATPVCAPGEVSVLIPGLPAIVWAAVALRTCLPREIPAAQGEARDKNA